MQISSFSSISPIGSLSSTPAKAPAPKAETTAAPAPAPASSSATAKSAPASAKSASHGGGADSAGTASTSDQIVAEYSTTVNGKSFGGSVEQSGNSYTATASGVAGASASASGSSIDAAENNLGALIDVLV
jgi:hypothetical protein